MATVRASTASTALSCIAPTPTASIEVSATTTPRQRARGCATGNRSTRARKYTNAEGRRRLTLTDYRHVIQLMVSDAAERVPSIIFGLQRP